MAKDIRRIVNNLQELEVAAEMGYVDPSVAMKINKFSRFSLTASTLSLASTFNNLNPFLDTPTTLYVSSSDAGDTGIPVLIYYIDQNRTMQQETVTLTGQTAVAMTGNVYCVWRMQNPNGTDYLGTISVGSEAIPVAGVPDAANTYCNIPISVGGITPVNNSLTGIFSIPAGYTGFFTSATIGADKGLDVNAASFARKLGGVFLYQENLSVFQSTANKKLFMRLPEKTDIKPLVYSQGGAGESGYLDYTILLVENGYLDTHVYA